MDSHNLTTLVQIMDFLSNFAHTPSFRIQSGLGLIPETVQIPERKLFSKCYFHHMKKQGYEEDGLISDSTWDSVENLSGKENDHKTVDKEIDSGVETAITRGCRFNNPHCGDLKRHVSTYKKVSRFAVMRCTTDSPYYKTQK